MGYFKILLQKILIWIMQDTLGKSCSNETPLEKANRGSPATKNCSGNRTTNKENSIHKESLEKSAGESQWDFNKVVEADGINFELNASS